MFSRREKERCIKSTLHCEQKVCTQIRRPSSFNLFLVYRQIMTILMSLTVTSWQTLKLVCSHCGTLDVQCTFLFLYLVKKNILYISSPDICLSAASQISSGIIRQNGPREGAQLAHCCKYLHITRKKKKDLVDSNMFLGLYFSCQCTETDDVTKSDHHQCQTNLKGLS